MLWFGLFLACDPAPSAAPAAPAASPSALVHLVPVASGFEQITDLQFPPGDSTHLAVLEKGGRASWLDLGTGARTPMFTRSVRSSSELGLLGLAFHPSWPAEPKVYVNYNPESGEMRTLIAEITLDPASGEDVSERALLEVVQPYGNHDAGQLRFGPDGMLYVGTGDNDRGELAQSLRSTFGKLLRIRPDGATPTDNPFVRETEGRYRAIWARGLRNAFTFDVQPGTGRMFVNDVGNSEWEEVNQAAAGANYGWPAYEGPQGGPGFRLPVHAYSHAQGCAITGGAFYSPARPAFPREWLGRYLYAEYCRNEIRWLDPENSEDFHVFGVTGVPGPVDLRVGPDGRLYVLARGNSAPTGGAHSSRGAVLRIAPGKAPAAREKSLGSGPGTP